MLACAIQLKLKKGYKAVLQNYVCVRPRRILRRKAEQLGPIPQNK